MGHNQLIEEAARAQAMCALNELRHILQGRDGAGLDERQKRILSLDPTGKDDLEKKASCWVFSALGQVPANLTELERLNKAIFILDEE